MRVPGLVYAQLQLVRGISVGVVNASCAHFPVLEVPTECKQPEEFVSEAEKNVFLESGV